MTWSDSLLSDIRRRVGLVDVISRSVKLVRRGRNHVGLCPFHREKTPSFTVDEEKGFYHCFGCGAHGDAFEFLIKTRGMDFPEAVRFLADQVGVPLPTAEDTPRAREKTGVYEAIAAARDWFSHQLAGEQAARARTYLEQRQVRAQTVRTFHLGLAPDSRYALREALRARGFGEDLLVEAGLLSKPEGGGQPYDRFRNRLIFPIDDHRGHPVAFGGRALGQDRAKYLNSPATPIFQKGNLLYAWTLSRPAMRKTGQAVVVEGYMDVIALHQAGITTAVAPLGSALGENQIALLWKIVDEPVVCFDGDGAGLAAAGRAGERAFPLLRPGKSLRFARLPAGEDPDSFVTAQGVDAIKALFRDATSMADWIWSSLATSTNFDTPERWAAFKRRIEQTTHRIADKDVRLEYRRDFDERFWHMRRSQQNARHLYPGKDGSTVNMSAPVKRGESVLNRQRDRSLDVKILLALALDYPWLIGEVGEELGLLTIENNDLDNLRQAMIDSPEDQKHDKIPFASYLTERGHGVALKAVGASGVRVHLPHLVETTQPCDRLVRRLWRERVESFHRLSLHSEKREAAKIMEKNYAQDSHHERFWALQKQLIDNKISTDIDLDDVPP